MGIDSMVHRIVGSRNNGSNTFTAQSSKSLYEGVRSPKRANRINENGGTMRSLRRRPLRRRGLFEDVDPATGAAPVAGAEVEATPVFNITCTNPECGYVGPIDAFVDEATGDLKCPQCGAIFDMPVPTGEGDVAGIEADGIDAGAETPAITEARVRRLRKRLAEAKRRVAARRMNEKRLANRRGRRIYEEDEYVDDVDAGAYEVPVDDIAIEEVPTSSAQVICGTCGYTANSTDYSVSIEDIDGFKEAYLICPSCAAKNAAGSVTGLDVVDDIAPVDDYVADEVVESRKLTPFKRVILRTLKENRAPRTVVKALYEGKMGVVNKFIKSVKKGR